MQVKKLTLPLSEVDIMNLRAGDSVLLSGDIYTARDAAHKKLYKMIQKGETLPVELRNMAVYYAGPTPAKPGRVIGSCGPTTSGRVDKYASVFLDLGLKVMIGKGLRNEEVRQAIKAHGGLYLVAVGGAAALISRSVTQAEEIAFPDLGTEAIRKLTVVDFPAVVGIGSQGRDIYTEPR